MKKEEKQAKAKELVTARYIGGAEKIMPTMGDRRAVIKPGETVPFKMRREEVEGRHDFEEIRKDKEEKKEKDVKKGGDSK